MKKAGRVWLIFRLWFCMFLSVNYLGFLKGLMRKSGNQKFPMFIKHIIHQEFYLFIYLILIMCVLEFFCCGFSTTLHVFAQKKLKERVKERKRICVSVCVNFFCRFWLSSTLYVFAICVCLFVYSFIYLFMCVFFAFWKYNSCLLML